MVRSIGAYYKSLAKDMRAAFNDAGRIGVDLAIDNINQNLEKRLIDLNDVTAGQLGAIQMQQLAGKSFNPLTRSKRFESEISGQLETFLLTNATKSVFFITDTDKSIAARLISIGINNGESTSNIADNLQRQFAGVLGQVRSARIARTETGIVGSKAQNQGARNLDAQSKQWLANDGARTRAHHNDVDGLVVGMEDVFRPNGELMSHPHDTSLGAGPGNFINCRCDLLYSR